jgi:hypothetical protein
MWLLAAGTSLPLIGSPKVPYFSRIRFSFLVNLRRRYFWSAGLLLWSSEESWMHDACNKAS